MKKKSIRIFTVITMSLFFLGMGMVGSPSLAGNEIDELRIGIGIDADSLYPQEQTTSLPMNICALIFDTYLRANPDASMKPVLLTGYEVSEDGLTNLLHLRKGVTFSDGAPFNAQAAKSNFDRVLDPKQRVPLRFIYLMIKDITIVDDYTLKITLKYPFAPFIPVIGEIMVSPVSPAAVEKYGEDVRNHPVGAGPYKLAEWVKGDRIVLVRNDNYWGKKPTVKKLIYKIIPETATREAMLRSGQLDICYKPLPSNVKALKADPDITVEMPVDTRAIFMSMNCQKGQTKNKLVRQAFNYAIDKKAIVKKLLFDVGVVSEGVGSPMNFGYHRMPNQYDYNPEKAKELLKKAGFDFSKTINMITPQGRYNFDKQISEAIQAQLQAIGVKVELRTYDWPTYMAIARKPLEETKLQLLLSGWGPTVLDADLTLFGQFHCKTNPPRGLGSAFYCNPEFDAVLEQSRREQDRGKRSELFRKASQIVWDDAPWIFLHTEKFLMAYKSNLQGLIITNTEMFYPTYCTWR